MLCLKTALQFIGQTGHRALERLKLLVQVGPQPFKFDRFGQILGFYFFVKILCVNLIVRIGFGDGQRRGRLLWGVAFGHICIVVYFVIRAVIKANLRCCGVLLFVLTLFGVGIGFIFGAFVLSGAVGILIIFFGLLSVVLRFVVHLIGVIAQLIAISKIGNDLPRKTGKIGLIGQNIVEIVQLFAGLTFDKIAPQLHHILRSGWQITASCQMADQISGGGRKRGIRAISDLLIAFLRGFCANFRVNIACCSGHITRAHGFAARHFHCLIKLLGNASLRAVFTVGCIIVIFSVQRQRIGGSARHENFITAHPAADLRQPHGIARQTRRIDRIGDRQFRIIGHHFGGLGKGLFKRIGWVVGVLCHWPSLAHSKKITSPKRSLFKSLVPCARAGRRGSRMLSPD